jgi:hypothetical protein
MRLRVWDLSRHNLCKNKARAYIFFSVQVKRSAPDAARGQNVETTIDSLQDKSQNMLCRLQYHACATLEHSSARNRNRQTHNLATSDRDDIIVSHRFPVGRHQCETWARRFAVSERNMVPCRRRDMQTERQHHCAASAHPQTPQPASLSNDSLLLS